MAIDAGTVVAFMELDTSRFTSGLSGAGEQMRQFMNSNNNAETRIQSLGGAMKSVGSTATTALTLPLVGVGAAAVKTSMDFEAQMSKVQAISGATGDNFNKLREQAIKLGADTAFSASEAAAGQENLASAGFNVNEIMSAMPGMLSLAAAGDVDIATASDIAGSSLRGFGLEASQATHVADVLAKTAADTNAGITDTGEAMKYVAPVAHAFGVSLEDTTAAIGLMSNAGIKGSQAGTTLRSALGSLTPTSKKAAATMEELGMNFFDAHGKMLPLGDVIQQLKDKTANLTQQQKTNAIQTIFGREAMSGMLALIDQGPDKFRSLEKGLKNCEGAGKEMASTMQNNLKGSIEAMKGSIETMGIRIGDVLAPGIRKAADFIGNLADKFSNLPKPIQTAIVYIGLMVATFGPVMIIFGTFINSTATVIGAIGKLGSAVSSVSKIFGVLRTAVNIFTILPALISPPVLIVVAIIAGLGLIVYEVIKHWDQVKSAAQKFGEGVKNVFSGIGDFFHKSIEGWKMLFANPGDFFPVGKWIEAGKNIIDGLIKGLGEKIASAKDSVKKLGSSIKDTFASILGIHSPSRVFYAFGINTGEGYINALNYMKSKVNSKISGFTEALDTINTKPKTLDISVNTNLSNINNIPDSKTLDIKVNTDFKSNLIKELTHISDTFDKFIDSINNTQIKPNIDNIKVPNTYTELTDRFNSNVFDKYVDLINKVERPISPSIDMSNILEALSNNKDNISNQLSDFNINSNIRFGNMSTIDPNFNISGIDSELLFAKDRIDSHLSDINVSPKVRTDTSDIYKALDRGFIDNIPVVSPDLDSSSIFDKVLSMKNSINSIPLTYKINPSFNSDIDNDLMSIDSKISDVPAVINPTTNMGDLLEQINPIKGVLGNMESKIVPNFILDKNKINTDLSNIVPGNTNANINYMHNMLLDINANNIDNTKTKITSELSEIAATPNIKPNINLSDIDNKDKINDLQSNVNFTSSIDKFSLFNSKNRINDEFQDISANPSVNADINYSLPDESMKPISPYVDMSNIFNQITNDKKKISSSFEDISAAPNISFKNSNIEKFIPSLDDSNVQNGFDGIEKRLQGIQNYGYDFSNSIGNNISKLDFGFSDFDVKDAFKSLVDSTKEVSNSFNQIVDNMKSVGSTTLSFPNLDDSVSNIMSRLQGIGNTKLNIPDIDVNMLGSPSNNNSNMSDNRTLIYSPNIEVNVSVSDVGAKGESELTNTLKDMTHNSIKNGVVEEFLKDAYRL